MRASEARLISELNNYFFGKFKVFEAHSSSEEGYHVEFKEGDLQIDQHFWAADEADYSQVCAVIKKTFEEAL